MSERKSITLSGTLKSEEKRNKIDEMMNRLKSQKLSYLELDLSKVEDIDFDTLALLLTKKKEFKEINTDMELKHIPKRIVRILQLFKVHAATGSQ